MQALGVEDYVVTAELSGFDQIKEMLSYIDKKGTQMDIVLNNAGVQVAYRDEYLKTPMSDYEISFKINTMDLQNSMLDEKHEKWYDDVGHMIIKTCGG